MTAVSEPAPHVFVGDTVGGLCRANGCGLAFSADVHCVDADAADRQKEAELHRLSEGVALLALKIAEDAGLAEAFRAGVDATCGIVGGNPVPGERKVIDPSAMAVEWLVSRGRARNEAVDAVAFAQMNLGTSLVDTAAELDAADRGDVRMTPTRHCPRCDSQIPAGGARCVDPECSKARVASTPQERIEQLARELRMAVAEYCEPGDAATQALIRLEEVVMWASKAV